jgi:DNA-binding CsgD family transcriptional regulator
VANYQSSIRQKLDVSNTAQVVRIALNHGMIASAPNDSGENAR